MRKKPNIFYGQSGGVTTVINSTACGVIETTRQHSDVFGNVLAGHHGILGLINEELFDTNKESARTIYDLRNMPGGVFGSCRYKLPEYSEDPNVYERIYEVLKAHNIHYFLYNGGNDSADTTRKLSIINRQFNYPLQCIGIPKTIDNDLPITDTCPGYGSVAKYMATITKEGGEDLSAMDETIQVYILTTMGRDSGWIAAASGLAKDSSHAAPHIILFPEIQLDIKKFLKKVKQSVKKCGHCFIVTANSIRGIDGEYIAPPTDADAFDHHHHPQIAPILSKKIADELGYVCHYAVPNFIQRAARHLSSQTDLKQAYAVGAAAVEFALAGKTNICPIIERLPGNNYRWQISETTIENIAGQAKFLPRNFIARDGFGVTKKYLEYAAPLIQGEDFIHFENGLPKHAELKRKLVRKKLK
ncbi:MAG: 6-phosphofructokinase [Gammaproteobacteria bacterium]|nr:6-phosphofructokinase [Gammaproteobacteria bacterium]